MRSIVLGSVMNATMRISLLHRGHAPWWHVMDMLSQYAKNRVHDRSVGEWTDLDPSSLAGVRANDLLVDAT
jgi:hypothetical protein